jgi:hypothetical protein
MGLVQIFPQRTQNDGTSFIGQRLYQPADLGTGLQ